MVVIIMETTSLLLGIAEDDEVCSNPFASLEEDAEELENDKSGLDDC